MNVQAGLSNASRPALRIATTAFNVLMMALLALLQYALY